MILNEPVISMRSVAKKLGNNEVLRDVNLDIFPGEVVGIVGKNGSGKTTLLRIIIGLMYPTKGEVIIEGKSVLPGLLGNLPTNVGALIETPSFLPQFTGLENLRMLASIRNEISAETIRNIMHEVGLLPDNRKSVAKYSLGMRQRLGISQAIMENPKIVLLDGNRCHPHNL